MKTLSRTNFRATAAVLIAASFASIATPRSAHAIIGLATGNIVLAAVGGGMAIFGGLGLAIEGSDSDINVQDAFGFTFLAGLVALDAKNEVAPSYTALSAAQAAPLGMSDSERNAYNSELDQINLIGQSIIAETMKENQPNTTATELQQSIQTQWANARDSISPDAFSGLQKVQKAISTSLQAHSK